MCYNQQHATYERNWVRYQKNAFGGDHQLVVGWLIGEIDSVGRISESEACEMPWTVCDNAIDSSVNNQLNQESHLSSTQYAADSH